MRDLGSLIYKFDELSVVFWSKIDIKNENDCWNWLASTSGKGYGQIRFKNKNYGANRVAYLLYYGIFDERLHVLHNCDNRLCCNPKHLFLGTNQDNVDDMVAKGRNAKFEKHGGAKLFWKDIKKIRKLYKDKKFNQKKLSEMYHISYQHISDIVNNKRWVDGGNRGQ